VFPISTAQTSSLPLLAQQLKYRTGKVCYNVKGEGQIEMPSKSNNETLLGFAITHIPVKLHQFLISNF